MADRKIPYQHDTYDTKLELNNLSQKVFRNLQEYDFLVDQLLFKIDRYERFIKDSYLDEAYAEFFEKESFDADVPF